VRAAVGLPGPPGAAEVFDLDPDAIGAGPDREMPARAVGDTKDKSGAVLRFTPAAWRRFAAQLKRSSAGA